MTVAEIDLRVGGKWRYVMVTPDGMEVGFHGEYREIVPNERIVSTETYEGLPEERIRRAECDGEHRDVRGSRRSARPSCSRAGAEQGDARRDRRVPRHGGRPADALGLIGKEVAVSLR